MNQHLLFLLFVITLSLTKCYSYTIGDSAGLGRTFDGIGGLSGGGATSKLLVNYPEPYRTQILDYLFLPNFAASLQILKVEIGGDSQSTDGTESSHMHTADDENYQRGYEWWLMTEAKARNPDIKLYGLPWAFPGWLGQGGSPYKTPNTTAMYIVKWIQGAKKHYNLDIDFVGIWNERNYDITYIKTLRRSLDDAGFKNIRMVAPDANWRKIQIADNVLKDPELANALYSIGVHYPGTMSSASAIKTGKQLWSSEDYSTYNDNVGGGCWARILNQNYVNGHMTSTISWNLIAAYYQSLPFYRDGLMTATEPWSGHYVVESPIWATAHTTQFTDIGWQYLQHGQGVGLLDKGGSYVSLVSPDRKYFTMVLETMSHDHSLCIRPSLPAYNVSAQTATFNLKGMLNGINKLSVWHSKLGYDGEKSMFFIEEAPIEVKDGMFSIDLKVDEIYTLTTSPMGRKGEFSTSPPSKPFPLPYMDDFEEYPEFSEAYNFAPQVGVWEVRKGDSGMVNRQVVPTQPVDWCKNVHPSNIGGDSTWADISVQMDVQVSSSGGPSGVFVAARVNRGGCGSDGAKGVFFWIFPTQNKFAISTDVAGGNIVDSGMYNMTTNTWYTLKLAVKGSNVVAMINSKVVCQKAVSSPSAKGFVGYGASNFGIADYDNMKIESADSVDFNKHLNYEPVKELDLNRMIYRKGAFDRL